MAIDHTIQFAGGLPVCGNHGHTLVSVYLTSPGPSHLRTDRRQPNGVKRGDLSSDHAGSGFLVAVFVISGLFLLIFATSVNMEIQ